MRLSTLALYKDKILIDGKVIIPMVRIISASEISCVTKSKYTGGGHSLLRDLYFFIIEYKNKEGFQATLQVVSKPNPFGGVDQYEKMSSYINEIKGNKVSKKNRNNPYEI